MNSGARNPAYLPQLDGFRGLAMLIVLFTHLPRPSDARVPSLIWESVHYTRLGDIALDSFFVMSGFLITRLLLAERARNGRIDLTQFYVRRALRIFPVYYAAVLLVTLIWPTSPGRTFSLLTYTYNFYLPFTRTPYPLEQSWSLAVEEQFYLLWPLLLVMTPRQWLRPLTLFVLPAGAIATSLILAVAAPPTLAAELTYMMLPTRMLALSLGCFLASLESEGGVVSRRQSCLSAALGLALLSTAVVGRAEGFVPAGGFYWCLVLPGFSSIAFGFITLLIHPQAPGWLLGIFRFQPSRFLGRISYAAYLAHVPVLFYLGLNAAALDEGPAPFARSLLAIAAALAIATLSLLLIERPMARLKNRLDGRARSVAQPVPS